MIFIVVKFETKPEWTERWVELVAGSPRPPAPSREPVVRVVAQRREPCRVRAGRAFPDGEAGAARQQRPLQQAMKDLPQALKSTPKIVSQTVDAPAGRDGRDDSGVTVRLDSTLWIYFSLLSAPRGPLSSHPPPLLAA